jgi:hypothetical protein
VHDLLNGGGGSLTYWHEDLDILTVDDKRVDDYVILFQMTLSIELGPRWGYCRGFVLAVVMSSQ